MDQAYEMFHEVLVKLFNDIMNIEAKAIITPEFRDITNNDMHVKRWESGNREICLRWRKRWGLR